MNKYKPVFFYILFAIIIPSRALFSQTITTDTADTDLDTTAKSELDLRYDSVLSKAALSLSSLNYNDAIAMYKEASVLKPANVFPYKMIIYSEDLAQKQRHADDLKRKAAIRDELNKANNAIAAKNWDSAKVYFNEVISSNPEKTDQEYAKSKIQSIDLELERIALRVPPKPAPVVVVVPKNRREARAMRKMAERNAALSPASTASGSQAQPAVPVQTANTIATPAVKTAQQRSPADIPPGKSANTVDSPAARQTAQKPTEIKVPQKTIAAAPATNQPAQKPIENSTTPDTIAAAHANNETLQKPAKDSLQQKPAETLATQKPASNSVSQNTITAAPSTNETMQKSTDTSAPQKKVAATPAINPPIQKPVENTVSQNTIAAAPSTNEKMRKPAEISIPQKTATAAPATKPNLRKQSETAVPQKTAAIATMSNQTKQRRSETSLPPVATTSPLSDVTSSAPRNSALTLVDSTDFVKLICQDISFIGTNAYIKVLIQNYSTTASFLTDTLQVSLKKTNGTMKKLGQRFISSFPVITPLNESIFVSFADASDGIDPDDTFVLEMRDKTKKTKLTLQIPWSVYQRQKNL